MEKYKESTLSIAERVNDLIKRMTLEEKVGQMCQVDGRNDTENWVYNKHIGSFLHVTGDDIFKIQKMASETRLGIPILFGIDAIHGHAFHSGATVFPTQLAMSSSWNPNLLEKVAEVTAKEVSLTGMHWTFSPVLCIARDVRWGRVDETFGEDPYLISILGKSMVKGYQGDDLSDEYRVMACAKHYAALGETQGGRDSSEADVSERKLRSIFLPPFKTAVEEGCATIMAAYEAIDGVPSSANKLLLKKILKEEWGFKGFVVTDWNNVGLMITHQKITPSYKEASKLAIEAGNDMIMSTPTFYENAINLVKEGLVDEKIIDESCKKILEYKFKLGLFDKKRFFDKEEASKIIGCKEHKKLSYEAALESIVLLENNNKTLPLSKKIKKIAVIGPNADNVQSQLGDWSFGTREHPEIPTLDYHPEYDISSIVTVLEGIQRIGKKNNIEIKYEKGCDVINEKNHNIEEAVKIAKDCEAIVLVLGDTNTLYGEFRDRINTNLTGAQELLFEELRKLNIPLIVVLLNGKPLMISKIKENANAILEAWNPGNEGGNAVASILFGDYNPLGKLTMSFPKHIGQQPTFYNQMPGWHGGRYIEMTAEPLYPFGYGLSYTKYEYSNLRVEKKSSNSEQELKVSVDIKNIGDIKGTEIVQVYVNDVYSSVTTPVKELKGFERVYLNPEEIKTVKIIIPINSLSLINQYNQEVVEKGEFEIMVGSSSKDCDLLKTTIEI